VNRSLSTVVFASNAPFLFASVVWIVVSIVLLVFAWDFWKEKTRDQKHEIMTLGKPRKD
jgi:membrane protein implicated in regulation of membrane protease activity